MDAAGNALSTGQIIDDEWIGYGIYITTNSPDDHPAMIFDTSFPTGNDWDLGTPNEDFGGPGIGSGGGMGQPGENSEPLGKALIISEDGDQSDPDDDANGGIFLFTFESPVIIATLQLIDIDNNNGVIKAFDTNNNIIGEFPIPAIGDNGVQSVNVNVSGVSKLKIILAGSGALSAVTFCEG